MRTFGFIFLASVIGEIVSLVAVGRWLGIGPALLWLILDVVAGIWLIRTMGRTLPASMGSRQSDQRGREGLLGPILKLQFRFMAGLLLIIPGFLSDAVALLLLLPPVRQWTGRFIADRFSNMVRPGTVTILDEVIIEEVRPGSERLFPPGKPAPDDHGDRPPSGR